ncbi:MAG: endo-1,4-beta-xylanase [Spirochaetaceae bacterium]|jgi:endo-1,4-beta-xylanase|nr:endo-1,4-beta-xylanase [Spirochaetaceae bacterium]
MRKRVFFGAVATAVAAFCVFFMFRFNLNGKNRPLKTVYKDYFLVGNILSPDMDKSRKFDFTAEQFNVITAENAMKPEALQKEKGVFTFEKADSLVNAVLDSGMVMHGHTLVWRQQTPQWMNFEGISREEAIENLTTHIRSVAGHFKGRVISWDVVNEAVSDNPQNPEDWRGSLSESPWLKAIGPQYIEIAFLAAREADGEARLYYNDYNLDNPKKARAVAAMAAELNEKNPNAGGRPLIDGVGMQGHYRLGTSPENVEKSINLFKSLNIEISVSELDVQAGADGKISESQLAEQGLLYAQLFDVYKKHAPAITRVTFWGLDDGSSWRRDSSPTLFNKDLTPKPAFFAVLDSEKYIKENNVSTLKEVKETQALYGTPAMNAKDVDPLWGESPEIPVNQYLMAWQGAQGTARALWDEKYLYVLITVSNAALNKDAQAPHEHDSVEVFLDEKNDKKSYFEADDRQFRVNFAGEASFNPEEAGAMFESAAWSYENAYTVVMKIPFKFISPKSGTSVGFDAQVNGASKTGGRESVAVWNDLSGESYQNTSGYGVLNLIKRAER